MWCVVWVPVCEIHTNEQRFRLVLFAERSGAIECQELEQLMGTMAIMYGMCVNI